jgi:hypothetical protein
MSSRQLAAGESESPVAESEVSKERGKHEEDNLVPGETTKKQAARSGNIPISRLGFSSASTSTSNFLSID